MKTLDQDRAADAMKKAKELETHPDKAEYSSYVKRLGAAVVMNGLGQALASELANSKERDSGGKFDAHGKLAQNISTWLGRPSGPYPGKNDPTSLLGAIMAQDQSRYLVAQADLMKWLEWHKKFCVAFLGKGE